jgi:hypothetical protein
MCRQCAKAGPVRSLAGWLCAQTFSTFVPAASGRAVWTLSDRGYGAASQETYDIERMDERAGFLRPHKAVACSALIQTCGSVP